MSRHPNPSPDELNRYTTRFYLTYDGAVEAANAAKKTGVVLRRAEACALLIADVDDGRRAADERPRREIPYSTSWWVTIG